MKTTKTLLTLVAVLALGVSALAQKMHPIEKLDMMFVKAMKMNDAKALADLFAPNAWVFPPEMAKAAGKEEIWKGFDKFFKETWVQDVMIKDVWRESAGDISTSAGWVTIVAKPKAGGETMTYDVRFSSIAKKMGRDWKFVSCHGSLPIPEAAKLAMAMMKDK